MRARKTYEIVTWMKLFAKHVGDKLPDEDITVLPYCMHCLKPLFEEYQDDLNAAQGLFGKPAEKSHFYDIFNQKSVELKIRLTRDTGSFVTCIVCDAYHTRLHQIRTLEQRQQLKALRRQH